MQPRAQSLLVPKLVPRSFPQRELRNQLPAFLFQAFCTRIGGGWEHGCTGFTATFFDLVTWLLPSIQIFESTIFGLSLCSWGMSADTLCLAEPANSLRCIFASALGIWR